MLIIRAARGWGSTPGKPAAWESKTLLPQGGFHQPKEKLPKKEKKKKKRPAAFRGAMSVTRTKCPSSQLLIQRGNISIRKRPQKGVEGKNCNMLGQQSGILC